MSFGFPTRPIREGGASILVPEVEAARRRPNGYAISRAPVFYTPRMRLNRDTAVLALGVHQRRLSRPVVVCEPMCGTGVRGIRLALEVAEVERVVLGDLNPLAVGLADENAALNGVSEKVETRLMDANLLLSLHDRPMGRFDYIDLDPYGSPAPYLDATVRACRSGGLVALTATDTAPLCGVNPRACLRKYGGLPLRTEYCHEVALRLVVGALVGAAARHDVAARPLFSYAADHYVRLYAVLERGARMADRCLDRMGYLLHCPGCSNRRTAPPGGPVKADECEVCGTRMTIGGPMWMDDLADPAFCDEMLALSRSSYLSSDRRLVKIITLVGGEVGFEPGFYDIDKLCSRLGVASLAADDVVSALGDAGFRAARTHFDDRGVKTDASVVEVENVLKRLVGYSGGGGHVP
ncbi:MAG: tRNA (guanine(10)-N(2))-dimethyltransferase [Candidatus Bathyarchaeia archaeon]